MPGESALVSLDDAAIIIGRLEAEKEAIAERFQCEIAAFRGYCGRVREAMQFAHDHNGLIEARLRLEAALRLPVPTPRTDARVA